MSNQKFTLPYAANERVSPKLMKNKSIIKLEFEGGCLKQEDSTSFTPNNLVNLFVFELDRWPKGLNGNLNLLL